MNSALSRLPLALLVGLQCATATPSPWLGPAPSGAAYPGGEEDRQFAMLNHDLQRRGHFERVAAETWRHDALVLPQDRDPLDLILRRAEALLGDLTAMAKARDLTTLRARLAALRATADRTDIKDAAARRELFTRACHLRRQIAFANPLLDFDSLLVLKRHRSVFNHCCDQYYGITQRPGGGLFVLENPFGDNPRIRDILQDARVTGGRLTGTQLTGGPKRNWQLSYDGGGNLRGEPTEGGSFLSPDLSYDGKSLAFAYVECQGERSHMHHTDPSRGHWAAGRSYHIFRMNLDGGELRQLTDGTWNDFDPCFMPGGRIAFISERRGGYLRCGRVCPNFTVHDMAGDGRDIRCLSFHETNEWHPSVNHDGMLVWTRWDYVDRHGCTAHHPWIMTPDGRDPRAIHGNFSPRNSRPDMELDLRAIPDSRRLVAVAAPHHGQAFGSLVMIDPNERDDDAMGPVRRITPDVGFPESQGGGECYGSPWPLSENYYLCAYRPEGRHALYGIYLVDAFGNRELIYQDPDISCHNPIPVKARPQPPAVPETAKRVPAHEETEATVSVVDVYHSQQPWPEGTRITALRIYQIFPMSVPSGGPPHETGLRLPQGMDSVNLARAVLGTVPVEADGSAHFIVPARRELFFQALDDQGLAVTSMRSATQLQPGETLTCQGCHEPKPHAPRLQNQSPLALQRPPSRIQPDVDGTRPFSYPRLVQPVLDRHCVACHAKSPDKAPRLDAGLQRHGRTTYFASYVSLAPKYGFFNYGGRGFADPKWYRTTPGAFGARAARLYQILAKGHHDVKLSAEDLHRITVWLDSCSLFYGVYEKPGGEAQLRGEIATPTLD